MHKHLFNLKFNQRKDILNFVFVCVLILINNSIAVAQKPKYKFIDWRVSAFPLPFGNAGMLVTGLGIDYGSSRNTVGFDIGWNGAQGSRENIKDTNGIEHDIGNIWTSTNISLMLNYRYYIIKPNDKFNPYLSPYVRIGKKLEHYDLLFPQEEYGHKLQYLDFGLALGAKFGSIPTDVNLGLSYRYYQLNYFKVENKTAKPIVEKDYVLRPRLYLGFVFNF